MTTTTSRHWNQKGTNSLLNKDDVGRAKPSTYKLPAEDFVYGHPPKSDQEGAKEITMTWKYHIKTPDQNPERDIIKLNKMSVNNRLFTSQDFRQFHKTHDAWQKVQKGQNQFGIVLPEENFRYGKPNRPSTPVKDIIQHSYGNELEQELVKKYTRIASAKQTGVKQSIDNFKKAKKTVASDFRDQAIKQQLQARESADKELFKLSKFKFVPAQVQTQFKKSQIKEQELRQSQSIQQTPQQSQRKSQIKVKVETALSDQYHIPSQKSIGNQDF